jgi:hypothetical protein
MLLFVGNLLQEMYTPVPFAEHFSISEVPAKSEHKYGILLCNGQCHGVFSERDLEPLKILLTSSMNCSEDVLISLG